MIILHKKCQKEVEYYDDGRQYFCRHCDKYILEPKYELDFIDDDEIENLFPETD